LQPTDDSSEGGEEVSVEEAEASVADHPVRDVKREAMKWTDNRVLKIEVANGSEIADERAVEVVVGAEGLTI
jgi:hypothetical protein